MNKYDLALPTSNMYTLVHKHQRCERLLTITCGWGWCAPASYWPLKMFRAPSQVLSGTVYNVLSTVMSVLMGTCAKLAGAHCAFTCATPIATADAADATLRPPSTNLRTSVLKFHSCRMHTRNLLPRHMDGCPMVLQRADSLKFCSTSQHVRTGPDAEIRTAMSRSRINDRSLGLCLSPVAVDKS